MLSDIVSFFTVIVGAIEFIVEFIVSTWTALDMAVAFAVESVSYILSLAPFIPFEVISFFFGMIALSVVFLIAGRQK